MARVPVPGPVVIPACIECKVHWSAGGHAWTNVLHGNTVGGGSIDSVLADALFTGFVTQFTSSGWSAACDAGTSLVRVTVKDLRSAYLAEFPSSGAPVNGTGAAGPLPLSVAVCITLKTAQSGRQYRGRVYFAGLDQAATTDATTFSPATSTAARAFAAGLDTVMTGNGMPMCVAQRALQAGTDINGNPLPARAAGTVDVVDYVATDNRFDSQRRRLGR